MQTWKSNLFLATCVAGVMVGAAPTLATVLNGGFEVAGAGGPTDAADWNEIEIAGGTMGATSTVDRLNVDPFSGDYAMHFNVTGAPDFGPVAEIQQQTAVGSVTPGDTYDFSFFAKDGAGPGSVAFYEVVWFDGDGSSGGGPQGSATGLQTFPLNLAYTEVSATSLLAPATADSVFISIRLVTGAFDGAVGAMTIDDVSFVPEPTALAMLALGGMLLRRRR